MLLDAEQNIVEIAGTYGGNVLFTIYPAAGLAFDEQRVFAPELTHVNYHKL